MDSDNLTDTTWTSTYRAARTRRRYTSTASTTSVTASTAARAGHQSMSESPTEWHTWRTARIGLPYLLTFAAQHFTGNQPAQKH